MKGRFILRRTDQGGGYVGPGGGSKAYTRFRRWARRFDTREAAEADRCPGNEVIEELREGEL